VIAPPGLTVLDPPAAGPPAAPAATARDRRRGPRVLLLAWLALSAVLALLALRNLSVPGLYYDEAVFGHLSRDFLAGRARGPRIPASEVVTLLGRPFPLFVQGYLGALKCWMLLPGIAVLGPSVAALRLTMLAWTLAGLLLFLLWARRLLGLPAAVLGGLLLGLDPSFYFISVCEWGSVVPSFLCRFAAFGLALRWWEGRRARHLFLAGLAGGLGIFNKIDFAVILAGCGAALAISLGRKLWEALREHPEHAAWGLAGLLSGAGPMVLRLPEIAGATLGGGQSGEPGEALEKARTLQTMLDGSYFYRLMEHGGDFRGMFSTPSPVWSPFGLVFALAFLLLAVFALRSWRHGTPDRTVAFLLLATALILAGTALLPGAVRLHHWTLVYPFPHLMIAAAVMRLWRMSDALPGAPRGLRPLAALAVLAALGGHLLAIGRTERLLAQTGGRGLWSDALDRFAAEVRNRRDLTIVSYDWGFHEPLAFLTDGPRLEEPTWSILAGRRFAVPSGANVLHLVHPPEYQVFPSNADLLRLAVRTDPAKVSVKAYTDRQGRPAFYALRFR
jgi:Dolichyl-phosphate-mannose-protein mannosyltransferase